jgi:hypothetical protein
VRKRRYDKNSETMRAVNSQAGEEAAALYEKRAQGPRERRELQRFNDQFVDSGRLRAVTRPPEILDPSHTPVPRTKDSKPTVVYVQQRMVKHGYKAGVIERPSEWRLYVDREKQ